MTSDRRRRSRVNTHFAVTYVSPVNKQIQLTTEDISLKGMLAVSNPEILSFEKGVIRISLSDDINILIDCVVIRSDSCGVAIEFTSMDADSFFHLRNIVRYNAQDADLIDNDITSHRKEYSKL